MSLRLLRDEDSVPTPQWFRSAVGASQETRVLDRDTVDIHEGAISKR